MQRATRNTILIVLFIALTTSLSCGSFGDSVHKIAGIVQDNQAKPIENATVSLERISNGETRKVDLDKITKADGSFEFSIVGSIPDNLKMTVKKDGFKVSEKQISASEKAAIIVTLDSEIK